MDIFYLFKLIYENIDSVIISLITGMITSIFVTKIYFIKQAEDDKVKEVRRHTEILPIINGFLMASEHYGEKEKVLTDLMSVEPIRTIVASEFIEINKISTTEYDKDLRDIHEKNSDLIANMHGFAEKPLNLAKIKRWRKDLDEIYKLCEIRYSYNVRNKLTYKGALKDKTIQIILLLTIACIVIA